MNKSGLERLEEEFREKQRQFAQAEQKYLEACQAYQPFADQQLLLTPPVARAAYSDRMAWVTALLSHLVYIPFETDPHEEQRLYYALKSGAFRLVRTFSRGSTQAMLVRSRTYRVLCFRGTQPERWEDVQVDLRAYKKATDDGRLHAGFNDAYGEIEQEILQSLLPSRKLPLYITGHSLGGALATVATRRLERIIGDDVAACYTFGSPRVVNSVFEGRIKSAFYRMVNTIDIVTLIPPGGWGYRHVGDVRYLPAERTQPRVMRGMPYGTRAWEMIAATLGALVRLQNPLRPWIEAHNIRVYADKLQRIAERNSTYT